MTFHLREVGCHPVKHPVLVLTLGVQQQAPCHCQLLSFTHVLTHLDWRLHPIRWVLPAGTASAKVKAVTASWPSGRWFTLDEALSAGVPAPLRKLLSSGSR